MAGEHFSKKNPDWEFKLSDNNDQCKYLQEHLSEKDYARLIDTHPIERNDVWRLLKMYHEGGLYMDIDRAANMNMDSILQEGTKMLLPTFMGFTNPPQFTDFTQDLLCTAPGNPMIKHVIDLNLKRRAECQDNGKSDRIACDIVGELGPTTFMHGSTQYMLGEMINRHPPNGSEQILTPLKRLSPTLITYAELSKCNTTIYREEDSEKCRAVLDGIKAGKHGFYNRFRVSKWQKTGHVHSSCPSQ